MYAFSPRPALQLLDRAVRALVAFGLVATIAAVFGFAAGVDAVSAATTVATSAAPSGARFYGARLDLGRGTASAYVRLEHGVPVALGLALDERAGGEQVGGAVLGDVAASLALVHPD